MESKLERRTNMVEVCANVASTPAAELPMGLELLITFIQNFWFPVLAGAVIYAISYWPVCDRFILWAWNKTIGSGHPIDRW